MKFGMIGLGRMGANMVRRLVRAGHDCAVYDVVLSNDNLICFTQNLLIE